MRGAGGASSRMPPGSRSRRPSPTCSSVARRGACRHSAAIASVFCHAATGTTGTPWTSRNVPVWDLSLSRVCADRNRAEHACVTRWRPQQHEFTRLGVPADRRAACSVPRRMRGKGTRVVIGNAATVVADGRDEARFRSVATVVAKPSAPQDASALFAAIAVDSTFTGDHSEDAAVAGQAEAGTLVGTRIRDPERYRIIGEHARGGLGCVTRAHDRELGRDVAIKELISRGNISEVRFMREALITARLEHPGIVPVHEAGRWPDGTPFYAMKLVAGRPLRDLIAERTTVEQRIGLLHHVIAVADAIAYAHGRNIIHRDLKPANVIVGDFGETVVIDWGLAKDLRAPDDTVAGASPQPDRHDGLTTTGNVLGTPAYMAPEQRRGERVDQRADVFAIGAMLWELCAPEKVPPADLGVRR